MPQKLTELETTLLSQLKELIAHVRAKDGTGNISNFFCAGCEKDRSAPCVLPKILNTIEEIEKPEEKPNDPV